MAKILTDGAIEVLRKGMGYQITMKLSSSSRGTSVVSAKYKSTREEALMWLVELGFTADRAAEFLAWADKE